MVRRTLTAAAVLAALIAGALPAIAQDCATVTIADRTITDRGGSNWKQNDGSGLIAADLVGGYLNIVVGSFDGPAGQEGFGGETSVAIPADNTTATICPDGSVTFDTPAAQPEPAPVNDGVERITPEELAELDPAVQATVPEHRIAYDFRPLAWR